MDRHPPVLARARGGDSADGAVGIAAPVDVVRALAVVGLVPGWEQAARAMMTYIWVVEMFTGTRWEACSYVAQTKAAAIRAARDYRDRNPDDRFRVALYERKRPL